MEMIASLVSFIFSSCDKSNTLFIKTYLSLYLHNAVTENTEIIGQ